jgi:hypothetical protein
MATLSHWYYNTESGELTQSTNSLTGFFTVLGFATAGAFGGAGWHELNISGTATEAQAAAEAKKEFPSGTTATTSVAGGLANAASQETTGSATTFSSVQNALTGFYDVLTNGKMWRSLGWLLLGVLMMIAGVALLLKGQITRDVAGSLAGL